jgi:hypothetical protein
MSKSASRPNSDLYCSYFPSTSIPDHRLRLTSGLFTYADMISSSRLAGKPLHRAVSVSQSALDKDYAEQMQS